MRPRSAVSIATRIVGAPRETNYYCLALRRCPAEAIWPHREREACNLTEVFHLLAEPLVRDRRSI